MPEHDKNIMDGTELRSLTRLTQEPSSIFCHVMMRSKGPISVFFHFVNRYINLGLPNSTSFLAPRLMPSSFHGLCVFPFQFLPPMFNTRTVRAYDPLILESIRDGSYKKKHIWAAIPSRGPPLPPTWDTLNIFFLNTSHSITHITYKISY